MIVLSGATLVLPDRLVSPGTVVIEGDRIAEIRSGAGHHPSAFAFHGHYIVPGFIDVHVHGLDGVDTLDGADSVTMMAGLMPRYGVTGFCPTAVACGPRALRALLAQVARAREAASSGSARVLPAHLESNFINPEFRGAQRAACLRSPREAVRAMAGRAEPPQVADDEVFDAIDILDEIHRAAADVGIVTLAPELDGALDLIAWLSERGQRASLGHSSATYDEAMAGIGAGARQATHLFNRMRPLHHRTPGLAGAILQSEETAAEIVCDGVHVHPAMIRMAVAAKRPSRIMAVTDGTALSARGSGASARLGGQPIVARDSAAFLSDGTLAGSTSTMDRVFGMLIDRVGLSPVDASVMCSTTPARELGLVGHGFLARDMVADIVVLDAEFGVVQTYVGGRLAYARSNAA